MTFKGRNNITYLDTLDEARKKARNIANQYKRICYIYETKETHQFFASRKTLEDFRVQARWASVEQLPFELVERRIPNAHFEAIYNLTSSEE